MKEAEDTFKSCGDEEESRTVEDSEVTGHSDTMMTQGFVPSTERYSPSNEIESKFTPIDHPLRQAAGIFGLHSE